MNDQSYIEGLIELRSQVITIWGSNPPAPDSYITGETLLETEDAIDVFKNKSVDSIDFDSIIFENTFLMDYISNVGRTYYLGAYLLYLLRELIGDFEDRGEPFKIPYPSMAIQIGIRSMSELWTSGLPPLKINVIRGLVLFLDKYDVFRADDINEQLLLSKVKAGEGR